MYLKGKRVQNVQKKSSERMYLKGKRVHKVQKKRSEKMYLKEKGVQKVQKKVQKVQKKFREDVFERKKFRKFRNYLKICRKKVQTMQKKI